MLVLLHDVHVITLACAVNLVPRLVACGAAAFRVSLSVQRPKGLCWRCRQHVVANVEAAADLITV